MEFLTKKKKYDKLWVGVIIGILGPVLGLWIYYLLLFRKYGISRIFEILGENTNLQSPMLSVALILNLVLLYLVFRFNYNEVGRGIVAGTFLYVPVILILKFFL